MPIAFDPKTSKEFYGTQVCGDENSLDLNSYWIQGKILHTASTLKIRITSGIQQNPNLASFGFRAIRINFANKTPADVQGTCVALDGSFAFKTMYGSNNCNCPYNTYANGAVCSPCHASCYSCFGGTNAHCYACKNTYSWDGTQCVSCPSNCMHCSGSTCLQCNVGYYLTWDNTCQSTCDPPYITSGTDRYLICQTPCQDSNNYMYWDNTCRSSCDYPLTIRIEGDAKFCDFSCPNPTDYLHWNGACLATCSYQPRLWSWRNFCDPCHKGLFLYPNGSCLATCESPFYLEVSGSSVLCKALCAPSQYLLGSTCVNTCSYPLKPITGNGPNTCSFPCADSNNFLYWNGSCLSTCTLNQRFVGGYKFCDACSSGSYLYPDGTCKSGCSAPFIHYVRTGYDECYFPCNGINEEFSAESYLECPSLYEYPYYLTSKGECEIQLTKEGMEGAVSVGNVLSKFGGFMSGLAIIALIIRPRDPRPFCLVLSLKMLEYFKFVSIHYPPFIQQVLYTQRFGLGLLDFAPNIPTQIYNAYHKYPIPAQFERLGYHSSFIINSWDALTSLLVTLFLIATLFAAEAYTKNLTYLKWIINKIRPALNLSAMLVYILLSTYFIDVLIDTSLEMRNLHLHSFHSVMSFLTAIAINLIVLFLLGRVLFAITEARKATLRSRNNQGLPSLARNPNRFRDYRIFFEICAEGKYFQHIYIFGFLIRVYLVGFVLGMVFDHAFVQAFFVILINFVMLLYLVIFRPFKELSALIQFIVMEGILFIAHGCLLALSILDTQCSEAFSTRNFLQGVIIASNFLLFILGGGYLSFIVIKEIFGTKIFYDCWEKIKELTSPPLARRNRPVPPLIQANQGSRQPANPANPGNQNLKQGIWSAFTPKFLSVPTGYNKTSEYFNQTAHASDLPKQNDEPLSERLDVSGFGQGNNDTSRLVANTSMVNYKADKPVFNIGFAEQAQNNERNNSAGLNQPRFNQSFIQNIDDSVGFPRKIASRGESVINYEENYPVDYNDQNNLSVDDLDEDLGQRSGYNN